MLRNLPLNALRAFEVVGRLQSVSRAADELGVTPGAVSKQIKHLEATLDLTLLTRVGTTIALTSVGEELHGRVTVSMVGFLDAVEFVKRDKVKGVLTVACMPAFASQWLIPRLREFCDRFPNIVLRLVSQSAKPLEDRGNADVIIEYLRGGLPGSQAVLLREMEFFPVCAPSLTRGATLRVADLARHTLFNGIDESHWHEWFQFQGTPIPRDVGTVEFSDFNHNLVAARVGLGIAMGDNVTCEADLECGALVRPFAGGLKSQYSGYYLSLSDRKPHSEQALSFRNWIVRAATEHH